MPNLDIERSFLHKFLPDATDAMPLQTVFSMYCRRQPYFLCLSWTAPNARSCQCQRHKYWCQANFQGKVKLSVRDSKLFGELWEVRCLFNAESCNIIKIWEICVYALCIVYKYNSVHFFALLYFTCVYVYVYVFVCILHLHLHSKVLVLIHSCFQLFISYGYSLASSPSLFAPYPCYLHNDLLLAICSP